MTEFGNHFRAKLPPTIDESRIPSSNTCAGLRGVAGVFAGGVGQDGVENTPDTTTTRLPKNDQEDHTP